MMRTSNYQLSSFLLLWFGLISIASVQSGPLNIEGPSREVSNNSIAEFDSSSKGCRYKGLLYNNYEEVSTDEPCLACQCKGTAVVCKLRICPEIPVPPPPGCIVVHKAKSCCSQLICHGQEPAKKISREQKFPTNISNETLLASVSNEAKDTEPAKKISREQKFPTNISNETLLASVSNEAKDTAGFCVLDGTVYAEGSAMRSSTLCQYCFCIRGEMKCSEPQCVIPLKGCNPQFRSYACCPTNYDCGRSNETAILKTLPSSTQIPQFLKGCLVNGQFVPEGEPVLPVQLAGYGGAQNASSQTNVCQTCFCMGGVVHCQPLECDKPIDGCLPIKEDGHCCPDRYDCSKSQDLLASPPTSASTTIRRNEVVQSLTSVTAEMTQDLSDPSSSTYLPIPTKQVILLSTNNAAQVDPSASATTVVSVLDETDSTTGTNEDSFERIASNVMTSSSEESTVLPPIQQPRVTLTTVAGFKNRSDLIGSREERRSKDADEISHKHSVEDDEKEEFAYHPLETTVSNAIEEFAATTVFDDVMNESTQDPEFDSVEADTTSINNLSIENVTENYISDEEDSETTTHQNSNNEEINQHLNMPFAEEDARSSDEVPIITTPLSVTTFSKFESSSNYPSTEAKVELMTYSEESSSSSTMSDEKISTTSASPSSSSSSTRGSLEFIPFGVEDARVTVNDSESLYSYNDGVSEGHLPYSASSEAPMEIIVHETPSETNIPVLKPLELKFFNGTDESTGVETESLEDALPILVEKDVQEPLHQFNVTSFMPVSTSLYNNGYYPHGDIVKDDGPAEELMISEGQVEDASINNSKNDELVNEVPTNIGSNSQLHGHGSLISKTDPTPPSFSSSLSPETTAAAINAYLDDKFIPSPYSPPSIQHSIGGVVNNNPTRTYSKFGMQDSPLFRYDHGSLDNNAFAYKPPTPTAAPGAVYHHRYYNPPEEFPPTHTQNSYNYYNTYNNKESSSKPNRGQSVGILPPMYKDNQFFYEDSSAALDSYEDYEPYLESSNGPSTPATPVPIPTTTKSSSISSGNGGSTHIPSSFQFLGERIRLPSYNQQRATSTPKYKYAYLNNNKVTLQSRPMAMTERTTTRADIKPPAPFPFNLPRQQDNLYNLGIKLSGCNVVGKMYSVGEIIEELSSDCLRCMCSDIGVHCLELKC